MPKQKQRKASPSNEVIFEIGSGNVFADIGLPNPEERLLKSQLMRAIDDEIQRRGLNQAGAAAKVGLLQPEISKIVHGRGSGFSVDRLMDILRKLELDVDISISRGTGALRVHQAISP